MGRQRTSRCDLGIRCVEDGQTVAIALGRTLGSLDAKWSGDDLGFAPRKLSNALTMSMTRELPTKHHDNDRQTLTEVSCCCTACRTKKSSSNKSAGRKTVGTARGTKGPQRWKARSLRSAEERTEDFQVQKTDADARQYQSAVECTDSALERRWSRKCRGNNSEWRRECWEKVMIGR